MVYNTEPVTLYITTTPHVYSSSDTWGLFAYRQDVILLVGKIEFYKMNKLRQKKMYKNVHNVRKGWGSPVSQ